MNARIDHLVVAAASLAEGAAWCQATLGVTANPGGEHPLMGTHNLLLRIATVNFPRAYLEIIAINPKQPEPRPPRAGRWFDLDDPPMRRALRDEGPRLVHFAACVPDAQAGVRALASLGIDRGPALAASRMTPRGLLAWSITVRDDGQRLFDGMLPTLIQWGDTHPAGSMGDSGVTLQSLAATHPRHDALGAAYAAIGLTDVALKPGSANLVARLMTPRGPVTLESKGL